MLRQWWNRYGMQTALVGLAIGTALVVRQTQGMPLYELYNLVTQPSRFADAPPDWAETALSLELQQRLVELENQNRELLSLVKDNRSTRGLAIPAPVIGRSPDYWWRYVMLGRGERQGVKVGSAITAVGGVVGQVIKVTPNTSFALLITDPTSGLGVMVSSRRRSQGYIRGKSEGEVVMRFYEKDPDVKQGDIIVTSSVSTMFPGGLPVGVVQEVNLNATPVPEARVTLTSPVGRLEWVNIVPRAGGTSK
jgi:rod shape-determining protein MreC